MLMGAAAVSSLAWLGQPLPAPCPRCVGRQVALQSAATPRVSSSSMILSDDNIEVDFATLGETGDTDPVGVLLLSVGAPEKPEDVEVRCPP